MSQLSPLVLMARVHSILERINATLREQYAEVASEPLPKRWIDLIIHLNERERANRPAETKPKPKPKPQHPNY